MNSKLILATKTGLVLLTVVLTAGGIHALVESDTAESSLHQMSRENWGWPSSQAVVELEKFEVALGRYAQNSSIEAKEEAILRYKILQNRLSVLSEGEFRRFIESDPSAQKALQAFRAMLTESGPLVNSLNGPKSSLRIMDLIHAIRPEMSGLASRAHQGQNEQISENMKSVIRQHNRFVLFTLGFVVSGILLASLLLLQNRMVRKAHESLSVALAQKTKAEAEMRRAKEAAEAADRIKTEFLTTISHELRTPLTAILGGAELLVAENRTDDEAQFIDMILRNGVQLASIIDSILDFSEAASGTLTLQVRPSSLRELMGDVARQLNPQAVAQGIVLSISVSQDVQDRFEMDRKRLFQVLTNLTGNAIKFTLQGNVRVHVTTTGQSDQRQNVRFEIADTGIGIPPESLGKLFLPFSQIESSLTRRFGGVGMGLAVSKHLIEHMHGQISFISEPGQGSKFWFVLPLPLATGRERAASGSS